MTKLIIGFVLGVFVSTVGFSGVTKVLDRGVQEIQQQSIQIIK